MLRDPSWDLNELPADGTRPTQKQAKTHLLPMQVSALVPYRPRQMLTADDFDWIWQCWQTVTEMEKTYPCWLLRVTKRTSVLAMTPPDFCYVSPIGAGRQLRWAPLPPVTPLGRSGSRWMEEQTSFHLGSPLFFRYDQNLVDDASHSRLAEEGKNPPPPWWMLQCGD